MTHRSRGLLTHGKITSLVVGLGLLASAFGSSQHSQVGANLKLMPTATSVSDAWPLADHVLTPGVFPGFDRRRPPMIIPSSSGWAAVEQPGSIQREAARLRALGFERAIDEQLHARFPVRARAVSIAEQYRSPAGARAQLAHQYGQLEHTHGVKVSAFLVGIPGAYGVRLGGGGIVALDVLFSAGPYYYVVAAEYPSNARNGVTATRIVAAARTLYLAITGCSGPAPTDSASAPAARTD